MSATTPFERVDIALGSRSYPIMIGPGLLEDQGLLASHVTARSLLIVTNETVGPLYLARLQGALSDRRLASISLPDGEQHKTLDSFARIIDALIANRMNRDAAVVALGGGVVGDMAGFAAACYQRGIDYIQVPTTLLAQVDSSVGGKTGVNHPAAKNMIGAFHQPRCVIADTTTLQTLPAREYRAGIAEIIKYGLIYDRAFLDWLEAHCERLAARDDAAVMHAVRRSCEIKAAVVSADEREQGLRAILNLGHTFGHAIETASGYGTWLHGEAVAAGMGVAADKAARARLDCRLGLPAGPRAHRALRFADRSSPHRRRQGSRAHGAGQEGAGRQDSPGVAARARAGRARQRLSGRSPARDAHGSFRLTLRP